jgi:uncharacterized protein YwqG
VPNLLAEKIIQFGFEDHRDFLLKIARPSIELLPSPDTIGFGCSKFGGEPDLPASFEWPVHSLGPYRFIGQINLSELPRVPVSVPSEGLLSFFYTYDEDGDAFWGAPDFIKVFHFEMNDEVRPVSPPVEVALGATSRIRFEAGFDLPSWPHKNLEKERWPIESSKEDAYWDLICALHLGVGHLFGFPFNTTLAYDPTPGPDWESLITLASKDDFEWCWHAGDWLVAFIETHRLRERDFSVIKSDAG